jgi:cobalt/nickel transport system permease protein
MKKVLALLAIVTLLVAGGLSIFASAYPDGLEWSIGKVAGTAELEAGGGLFDKAAAMQGSTAFMPDYAFAGGGGGLVRGTAVAGLVGSSLTFALAGAAGLVITAVKKKKKRDASA